MTQRKGALYAKSGIKIKPENRGKFTEWAKARGMGVQEAAHKVLAAKEGVYSPEVRKMANFARNSAQWKQEGGFVNQPSLHYGNLTEEDSWENRTLPVKPDEPRAKEYLEPGPKFTTEDPVAQEMLSMLQSGVQPNDLTNFMVDQGIDEKAARGFMARLIAASGAPGRSLKEGGSVYRERGGPMRKQDAQALSGAAHAKLMEEAQMLQEGGIASTWSSHEPISLDFGEKLKEWGKVPLSERAKSLLGLFSNDEEAPKVKEISETEVAETELPGVLPIPADEALVDASEGFREDVYLDTEGFPTVGTGHRLPDEFRDMEGQRPFTREELASMKADDLEMAREMARANVENFDDLPREVRAGLVSQAFQLGGEGQSEFENMLDALKKKDFSRAANESLNSLWAQQTPERASHFAGILRKHS